MTPPLLLRTNALFLDLDGTLAPLRDDPFAVDLSPTTRVLLSRLASFLGGAAAIVSGRDLRDLDLRTPRSIMRIGAHGLEAAAPGAAPSPLPAVSPPRLVAAMAGIAEGHPGAWLEAKGPVVAIHYRHAPQAAQAIHEQVAAVVAAEPSYAVQTGKMVIEAKPENANKGRALSAAMALPLFARRTPVMVGDDATDEDAFGVVEDFGGYAVKVGAGVTRATFRIDTPAEVIGWLRRSVG